MLVSDLVALRSSRWTPLVYQNVCLRTTDSLQLAALISASLLGAVSVTARLRACRALQLQAVLDAMIEIVPLHSIPLLALNAMHLRKERRRKRKNNKIKATLTGQSREVQLNIAHLQNSTALLTNVDRMPTVQATP